jgi:O-antigen ligase
VSKVITPSSTAPNLRTSSLEQIDTSGGEQRVTPQKAAQSVSTLAVVAGRVHYAALLLVVLQSPFEAGYQPVGRFLWAIFTNLEAALFILGATWLFKLAVDPTARLRLVRLPLLAPILALLGAAAVSSIFGEYRALGPQFIYRLLVGVMVYASAYEALREKRRLVVALCTFVGAGAVSAVLGLLEFAPGINIQPWLKMFKPQPTTVGGMVRLSGSFEYANGAAVYFEMALPVLLGVIILLARYQVRSTKYEVPSTKLSAGSRLSLGTWYLVLRTWYLPRRGVLALLFVMSIVYMMALILTYSRAALVGLLIALGVLGTVSLLRRRTAERWLVPVAWRTLGLAAAALLLSGLFVFLTQPMFRLRLTTENDRDWYGATVTAEPLPTLSAGEVVTVPLTLLNNGQMTWPAGGVLPVNVSYHWLSATEEEYLVFDGVRTALPHDISPGETVSVNAIVQAPPQPGDYRLQWDLVHENVTWFAGKQGMIEDVRAYHVGEATSADSKELPQSAMPPPMALVMNTDFASVGRGQLWSVALEMFRAHPIVGVGPDGFRNLYGEYAGVTQWNKNIYTNNTYLEMFTDLGIVGGLAFLWLGGLALWRAWRNLLREPVGTAWILGLGATAAIVAFFAHGVVDYFLFATPIYVIFWFLTAVAVNWPAAVVSRPTTDDGRPTT